MGMMQCRMILHGLDFDMSGVYDEEEEPVKMNCELLRPQGSETLRRQGPVVNVIMLNLTRANLHSCWGPCN